MRSLWFLNIFHTSDIHGRLPASKEKFIRSLIAEVRDEVNEVLLLDSGDALIGSNTLVSPFEPALSRMNKLGYTAMAIGNREFHYLYPIFLLRAKAFKFPLISSNLIPPRASTPSSPILDLALRNLRVGILGFTPPQYKRNSLWSKVFRWKFLSVQEAIQDLMFYFHSKGFPHLLIALSHLGAHEDEELARELKDKVRAQLILILGGHSHQRFIKEVDGVLIIHPGAYLSHISHTRIMIKSHENEELKLELVKADLIEVKALRER